MLAELSVNQLGHLLLDLGRVLSVDESKLYNGSQFEEDLLLGLLLTESTGSYVDVGAAHYKHLSNTYQFYKRGWRGLLVEPRPDAWQGLLRNRPGDWLYPAAAGDYNGRAIMKIQGELSSLDSNWPDYEAKPLSVEVARLDLIVSLYPRLQQRCDLLNIDVEGYEPQALAGIEFESFRPRVIVVEAWSHDGDDTSAQWEPRLLAHDYILATQTQLNRIYVSKESGLISVPLPSFPRALPSVPTDDCFK